MKAKPLYDSKDYKEFVKNEKAKGLIRSEWKNLPKLYQKELDFRAEFEQALDNFEKRGGIIKSLN